MHSFVKAEIHETPGADSVFRGYLNRSQILKMNGLEIYGMTEERQAQLLESLLEQSELLRPYCS